jgi:tRNA modification GTPase
LRAVATPTGEGGVGIVGVSGPDAERIVAALFVRAEGKNGELKSHMLHYGTIRDPKSERILDQVLLTIMRKPRSYTREDVVEVHCHGTGRPLGGADFLDQLEQ